jgi:hypothetical protein
MPFIPTFMEVGLVEYENYAKEFKCFEVVNIQSAVLL